MSNRNDAIRALLIHPKGLRASELLARCIANGVITRREANLEHVDWMRYIRRACCEHRDERGLPFALAVTSGADPLLKQLTDCSSEECTAETMALRESGERQIATAERMRAHKPDTPLPEGEWEIDENDAAAVARRAIRRLLIAHPAMEVSLIDLATEYFAVEELHAVGMQYAFELIAEAIDEVDPRSGLPFALWTRQRESIHKQLRNPRQRRTKGDD